MKKYLFKFFNFSVIFILSLSILSCSSTNEKSFILATTTSTQDSGLLDFIIPKFEKETGIKVKVIAKGTGEALEMGKRGDADCLLVHAKSKEEQFIKDGYALKRYDVMYNDFVIVGPQNDSAKVKSADNDPLLSFKKIYEKKAAFISRGDDSGTHIKEKEIWKKLNVNPSGDWYISAGTGMGAVLKMADEKGAYTLTDRATYLSMKDKISLIIVAEKNPILYNQYGIMMVNPKKHKIKEKEVQNFIEWILSDKAQKLIGEYGRDKYGQSLFIPNAKK